MTEDRPSPAATTRPGGAAQPTLGSTMDRLNRGALPPDDPLVRLREAIDDLRALESRHRRLALEGGPLVRFARRLERLLTTGR